jgi:hypothetical protein
MEINQAKPILGNREAAEEAAKIGAAMGCKAR